MPERAAEQISTDRRAEGGAIKILASIRRASRREELTVLVGLASLWGHLGHGVPWEHILTDLILTPGLFFLVAWPAWKWLFPATHVRVHIESVIRAPMGATVASEITTE